MRLNKQNKTKQNNQNQRWNQNVDKSPAKKQQQQQQQNKTNKKPHSKQTNKQKKETRLVISLTIMKCLIGKSTNYYRNWQIIAFKSNIHTK